MERELKRIKNGRLYLIPASEDTRGHGTTGMARLLEAAGRGIAADRAAPDDVKSEHQGEGRALDALVLLSVSKSYTS